MNVLSSHTLQSVTMKTSHGGECWVITDGAAGNERQAMALAQTTGLIIRPFRVQLRRPWAWAAPRLLPASLLALPPVQRAQFRPPWPRVVIGCGRASAMLTRLVGQLSDRRTYTVQILDPRLDTRFWNLVVAPVHDELKAANVIEMTGSLNPIDDTWLAEGREACPTLGDLPKPRRAILLGGERRGIELGAPYARQLVESLRAMAAREGGSFMISSSRRTPAAFRDAVVAGLADFPGHVWTGGDDAGNPYAGYLGWADSLVVTPDSVNMLSEACATGRPVRTLVTAPLPAKLARLHATLRSRNLLGDLDDHLPSSFTPLRETQRVGLELRRRMLEYVGPVAS